MNRDDVPAMLGLSANDDHDDAIGQLVESAAARGDLDELRRLADAGSKDAVDQLVELAQERGDVGELRRLADNGNQDAADILLEMAEEADGPK